jgi:methionine biosynthesis protein MetW
MNQPDECAKGFVSQPVDPLRYGGHSDDPHEAAGLICSMIPHRTRVLDVGCGTGEMTALIQSRCAADVLGVEPDERRAMRAAQRGLDIRVGIFDEAFLRTAGLFDVIVFADVLEHLSDPTSLLRMAGQALRPNGCVVASVPNVAHWSVRIDLLIGRFDYSPCGIMDATHLRWFTARGLDLLFRSAGFRIEDYKASAGAGFSESIGRRPWRWLPARYRTPALQFLARKWPTAFGVQHVVRAALT